jgi:hypothetical protein
MIENEKQYEVTKQQKEKLEECLKNNETLTWIEIAQADALQSLIDELDDLLLIYENRPGQTNSGSE